MPDDRVTEEELAAWEALLNAHDPRKRLPGPLPLMQWTRALIAEVRRLREVEAAVVRFAEAASAIQECMTTGVPAKGPGGAIDGLLEARAEILRLGKEAHHE